MDNKKRIVDTLHEYYRLYDKADLTDNDYRFHMEQNISELVKVLDYLGDRKFENFVELGGSYGGSLWVYSNLLCKPKSRIMTIEKNDRCKGLSIVTNALNAKGFKAGIRWKDTVNSKDDIHFKFDLLHIDAFHTYEAVKRDYNAYFPMVNKGGIILFHDAIMHPGVSQFLREINVTKIMASDGGFRCGIGILEK